MPKPNVDKPDALKKRIDYLEKKTSNLFTQDLHDLLSHPNKTVLDSYTQTQSNILSEMSLSDSETINTFQLYLAYKADLVNGKIPSGQLPFDGLSKITVGTTEPTNPSVGDLWIDTN